MGHTAVVKPDWYPDPYASGMLRWWDGSAWTADVRPIPVGWGVPADPGADLAEERKWAARASMMVFVSAAILAVEYLVIATVFGHLVHTLVREVRDATRATAAQPHVFRGFGIGQTLLIDLSGLVALGVQVIFMTWLYQAATISRRAGLPARREPVWAFVGFLVPIVSIWFPYQVAADLFAPDDSNRRLAGRWWGLYLSQGFAVMLILIIAAISTPVAVIVALACTVLPIMTAMTARAMIAAVGHAHSRLLVP